MTITRWAGGLLIVGLTLIGSAPSLAALGFAVVLFLLIPHRWGGR